MAEMIMGPVVFANAIARAVSAAPRPAASCSAVDARLVGLVREHLPRVHRLLRHLGVSLADADDAVQQVFLVLSRRLDLVAPGRERAFLSAAALKIASRARRTRRRRREELEPDLLDLAVSSMPSPEFRLERLQAEQLLGEVLERIPDQQREVFVLYELEELTMREIADLLGIPQGTVASRIRNARMRFHAEVRALAVGLEGRVGP